MLAARDLAVWGAVALVGGLLVLTAGIGVFHGRSWARWTAIVLAVSGVLWNIGWAEIQPAQALIGAFMFISVIYALATTPVAVDTGA